MKLTELPQILREALAHGQEPHENLHLLEKPSAWMALRRANMRPQQLHEVVNAVNAIGELKHILGKCLNAPGNDYQFTADGLAQWLLDRSLKLGHDAAVNDLAGFSTAREWPIREYLAFSGLAVEAPCELGKDISIIPISAIEESDVSITAADPTWSRYGRAREGGLFKRHFYQESIQANARGTLFNRNTNAATAVLARTVSVTPVLTDNPPTASLRPGMLEMRAVLELIPIVTLTPVFPVLHWHGLPGNTPMGGVGYHASSFHNRDDSPRASSLAPHARNIQRLAQRYLNLLPDRKVALTVPLGRFNRALATHTIDRAIELGIALEALLLSGMKSTEQLSLTFRLRGAWLLGRDRKARRDLAEQFKALYNARSTAVHSGELSPKAYKIAGEDVPPLDFLSDGGLACRLAASTLEEVIVHGEKIDFDSLILGYE